MTEFWEFLKEVHEFNHLPSDNVPEVIFWGRSNVGKSSLINSITNSKIAKTSKNPGRTRALVFFQLQKTLRIVDFPGYGYSKIPKLDEYKLDKLIDKYLQKRRNINKLFLLIDSKHGFKKIDQIIINQLNVHLKNKIFIIFTKKDRLKNKKEKDLLKNYNKLVDEELDKKFFNTSIKEINTIILLKKFILNSL